MKITRFIGHIITKPHISMKITSCFLNLSPKALIIFSMETLIFQCISGKYQIQKKMKFIYLSLFLILTHQLNIQRHEIVYPTDPDKPLDGHIFIMVKNYLNDEQLNGYIFYFNHDGFDFRGCNHNWGLYQAGKDGSFKVSKDFMATLHHCKEDKDRLIQQLFINSTSYKLDGQNLILTGKQGEIKFVPWATG